MRIVVGIDSGNGSRAALRYALAEAAAHRAELVVVHAWDVGFEDVNVNDALETLRLVGARQAADLVDSMIRQAQAERPRPAEQVTPLPVQGEAVEVVLAQAREGDVIVVGANRGGVLRRLVLGSVCAKVVEAARCPVTVVPPGDPDGMPGEAPSP